MAKCDSYIFIFLTMTEPSLIQKKENIVQGKQIAEKALEDLFKVYGGCQSKPIIKITSQPSPVLNSQRG